MSSSVEVRQQVVSQLLYARAELANDVDALIKSAKKLADFICGENSTNKPLTASECEAISSQSNSATSS